MKTLLLVSVSMLVLGLPTMEAFAVHPDSGPGCGLGKIAWQDYKHPEMIGPQLLMSTTNNTILPWQAFGITSGTLGCKNNGKWFAEHKAAVFANLNFEDLSQDMAQGRGEHLASLATLLGVPAEHQAEFFAMTQEQYTSLIQSGEASPVALVRALHDAMSGHPVLAKLSTTR
jgi:DUF3015 family protein